MKPFLRQQLARYADRLGELEFLLSRPPTPVEHSPMSRPQKSFASRREFLKTSSQVVAASALAGVALPHVHAAENNTIQLALIGCGGRGTGAVAAFSSVNRT